jgi:CMP/dCMP kinase
MMARDDFSSVVVVEGPSGTGKTALLSGLQQRFDCTPLEFGVLVRTVAWWSNSHSVPLSSAVAALDNLDRRAAIRLGNGVPASLAAADILIHNAALARKVFEPHLNQSLVAASQHDASVGWVKGFARDQLRGRRAVVSGRNIAMSALSTAGLVIRLTADATVRARRKHAQLAAAGLAGGWYDDSGLLGPILPGALIIDTTSISAGALLARVAKLIERSLGWHTVDCRRNAALLSKSSLLEPIWGSALLAGQPHIESRDRQWAILDSNQGPLPYQRSALTD